MKTIDIGKVGRELSDLISQKDPTEEDIGIEMVILAMQTMLSTLNG